MSDKIAELLQAAKDVADEHFGAVAAIRYFGEDDEIGERVCCGVLSYEPHAADCQAVRLRSALAKFA